MAVLPAPAYPAPVLRTIRAAADVVEVEAGRGFCASVLLMPGMVPVARLDRSLRGAGHEGEVLYDVMMTTTGVHGLGLFVWHLSPDGVLVRS